MFIPTEKLRKWPINKKNPEPWNPHVHLGPIPPGESTRAWLQMQLINRSPWGQQVMPKRKKIKVCRTCGRDI